MTGQRASGSPSVSTAVLDNVTRAISCARIGCKMPCHAMPVKWLRSLHRSSADLWRLCTTSAPQLRSSTNTASTGTLPRGHPLPAPIPWGASLALFRLLQNGLSSLGSLLILVLLLGVVGYQAEIHESVIRQTAGSYSSSMWPFACPLPLTIDLPYQVCPSPLPTFRILPPH